MVDDDIPPMVDSRRIPYDTVYMSKTSFQEVVDYFGSQAETARRLGVGRAFVNKLCKGNKPVPPLRALQIEQVTGARFKAVDLNPRCGLLSRAA